MKVFKRFFIKNPERLDDSYVSAATDGHTLGLSIHDGANTIALNFNLETDREMAQQTLEGLELVIQFLRKAGSLPRSETGSLALNLMRKLQRVMTSDPGH